MSRFSSRIGAVLLLAVAPLAVPSQSALGQEPVLQPGSRARVVLLNPRVAFEGSVTETWDDGFAVKIGGGETPRRVDFTEVESLQRSLQLGTKWRKGALIGGAVLGVPGFLVGYCFEWFNNDCAKNLGTGLGVGLITAAIGGAIGGGIGLLVKNYGPWEPVTGLGGSGRSGDLDRLSVDLLAQPGGRIGLGVTLRGL